MRYELWSVEYREIVPRRSVWRKAVDWLLGRAARTELRVVRGRLWGRFREEAEAVDAVELLDPLERSDPPRDWEVVAVEGNSPLMPVEYAMRQNGYPATPSLSLAS